MLIIQHMKKLIPVFCLISLSVLKAQTPEPTRTFDKHYFASASEIIFSAGELGKVTLFSPINMPLFHWGRLKIQM